jgi:hypothetical protein
LHDSFAVRVRCRTGKDGLAREFCGIGEGTCLVRKAVEAECLGAHGLVDVLDRIAHIRGEGWVPEEREVQESGFVAAAEQETKKTPMCRRMSSRWTRVL